VNNQVPRASKGFRLGAARAVSTTVRPWCNDRITILHFCLDTLLVGNNLATTLGLLLDNTRTKSLVDVLNIPFNFAGAEDDLGKALKAKGREVSKLLDPIIKYVLLVISSSICSLLS
jgi:hypothetical protein